MLVGGKALKIGLDNIGCWFPRETSDTDIWSYAPQRGGPVKGVDYCQMPREIMEKFEVQSKIKGVATLEDLYTIKLSHLVYDIFWWKHAQDLLLIKKYNLGWYNVHLYDGLKNHWKKEFGEKDYLSLYKTKDEFFDDFVPKKHEHDYLHKLVAVDEIPVYTKCLKDGHEVFIDKDKFMSMSLKDRVRMFKEEIAVIALERWIIPSLTSSKESFTIAQAWNKSLRKTVTALTKNWASEFIVFNLEEFLSPLKDEILHALEVLNLKEKYMSNKLTLEGLKEMLVNRVVLNKYYVVDTDGMGEVEAAEALAEAQRSAIDDCFTDFLIGYDDDLFDETVSHIYNEGGGEGGAEDCESVIRVDNTFYKVSFNYYSHHGYEFDYAEVREVQGKQKTVTVYE